MSFDILYVKPSKLTTTQRRCSIRSYCYQYKCHVGLKGATVKLEKLKRNRTNGCTMSESCKRGEHGRMKERLRWQGRDNWPTHRRLGGLAAARGLESKFLNGTSRQPPWHTCPATIIWLQKRFNCNIFAFWFQIGYVILGDTLILLLKFEFIWSNKSPIFQKHDKKFHL